MIQFALALHYISNMDSVLGTTREFWRRKSGLPEHIVIDPRPMADIFAELESAEPKAQGRHLRAVGIGRDPENDQVVFISLNRPPSDDELRAIHGAIGRTPKSCPFCYKPTYVLPCSHCGEPDVPHDQF